MAIVSLVGLGILLVGGGIFIALQIFLATRPNKWLGLILPGLQFIFSIMGAYGYKDAYGSTANLTWVLIVFGVLNIPTLISLGIYLISHNTGNRNDKAYMNSVKNTDNKDYIVKNDDELKKMKINDL